MKFIKWKKSSQSEESPLFIQKNFGVSIFWCSKRSAYAISHGETIGTVVFTCRKEAHEWMENGPTNEVLNQIKLAGYDPNLIDFLPGDLTTFNSFHGQGYETELIYTPNKNKLPFGVFEMKTGENHETLFKPYKMQKEKLNLIKNKNLKEIVLDFFNNKVDTGRKDKMGVLLYGPPGNGKTTEIMELFKICEENKLRIFICDSDFSLRRFSSVRNLLSENNCIFVLEEVTERLTKGGVEEILTFLDGENSWSNSITIATTNYPEDLPANLVDRPGRFETFIEYGNPNEIEIIELGNAFGFNEEASRTLVKQGLSFDYVSFIFSQAKKLNKTVKETREFEEEKRKRLSSTFKGKMGI